MVYLVGPAYGDTKFENASSSDCGDTKAIDPGSV